MRAERALRRSRNVGSASAAAMSATVFGPRFGISRSRPSDIARTCPTVITPMRHSEFSHRRRSTDLANASSSAFDHSRISSIIADSAPSSARTPCASGPSGPPPPGTCWPPTANATARNALLFVPSVALAHRTAGVFREAGIPAEALDGTTPPEQRYKILARVHRGETRVLASTTRGAASGKRQMSHRPPGEIGQSVVMDHRGRCSGRCGLCCLALGAARGREVGCRSIGLTQRVADGGM